MMAQTLRPIHSNRLVVQKRHLFVFRAFVNGHWKETVKAPNAPSIVDYVRDTYPPGTKVTWVIIPRHECPDCDWPSYLR